MFVDRAAVDLLVIRQISISFWEVGSRFPGVQKDCLFLTFLTIDVGTCPRPADS